MIVIIAIWEVISKLQFFPTFMFPPLIIPNDPGGVTVIKTLVTGILSGQILEATGVTLGRLLIGFFIAVILGLTFGFLIARYKWVDDTLGFFVTALQSIPSIVWFPLAIVWFGLGNVAILFIVAIGATMDDDRQFERRIQKCPEHLYRCRPYTRGLRHPSGADRHHTRLRPAHHIGTACCMGIRMAGHHGR